MHASEINVQGALNFVGGFWRDVRGVLAYQGAMPEHLAYKAETLAWLQSDSFLAWCRFGGVNFDPDWLRDVLLSGETPAFLRYEV